MEASGKFFLLKKGCKKGLLALLGFRHGPVKVAYLELLQPFCQRGEINQGTNAKMLRMAEQKD